MTTLLEIKERIRSFCVRYEIYLRPILRALLAFAVFSTIRSGIGYMTRLNSITLLLVLSLSCALLPAGMILVLAIVLILLHLYALSAAACVVCLLVLLVMFLLYFRFMPKNSYYALLMPLALVFHVPYIVPVALGLLCDNPLPILAMACGALMYYLLSGIAVNATAIAEMTEDDTIISKFGEVMHQFTGNKEMIAMVLILSITALLVWFLRRLSIDHAWIIAISTGCMVELVLSLICDLQLALSLDMLYVVLGVLSAALVGLLLQFFFFNLDYTRTERVRFEDDDYYYYVKAVPKLYVSGSDKKIQKFSGDDVPVSKKELAKEMDIDEELLDF